MLSSVNWAGDKGGTATALGRQERVSGTSSRSGGGAGTGEGGEAVLSVVVVEVDGEGISGERRNQLPGRFAAVRSRWPARHPKLFFSIGDAGQPASSPGGAPPTPKKAAARHSR